MDASVQGSLDSLEPTDHTLLGWDLSKGLRLRDRDSHVINGGGAPMTDLTLDPPNSDPIPTFYSLLKSVVLQGNNNPKSQSFLNRDLCHESGASNPICCLRGSPMYATPHKKHSEVVQLERPFGRAGTQQALISCLTQLLPAFL